ncbi:response regulator [Aquincola sp. S2]|uniref:Response regulator n=1 Tax=Pseudaquabacterium terrae TaxID=2732868 RepID=A0ABX2EPA3_9BURK|nr:response regulator [Aquabacterium terrae]
MERPDFSGVRVLLAEDNLINQEVAVELLQVVGAVVDVSLDGLAAVACATRSPYDLVLMDVQMPGLDGLEATRRIRLLPAHARTPILAMTANAFGEDRAACLAAGMNDHIAKPVDPQQLYGLMQRWLNLAPGDWPQPTPPPPRPPIETGPLAVIPGLVMSRALMYLPGRDEIFMRVLQRFADDYYAGLPRITALLASGEHRQARALVHTLRGSCGAIGAVNLSEQALAYEEALERAERGGADGNALADAERSLQRALAGLTGAIRSALRERPPGQ